MKQYIIFMPDKWGVGSPDNCPMADIGGCYRNCTVSDIHDIICPIAKSTPHLDITGTALYLQEMESKKRKDIK